MDFNDMDFPVGSVNPSGIADEVYFILKRQIRAWPPITDDIMTAMVENGYVQYGDGEDDSFTIAYDAVWHRLYNTQGKGSVTWDYLGETDCRVVVNKATMVFPKITNEARAFAKHAANGDLVFVAKHDGRYYVIGSKNYRATLTPNGNSGDTPGSAKGLTVNIECCDETPLPVYVGTLLFEDGVLDCKTDTYINYNDMSTNFKKEYEVEGGTTVRFNALSQQGRMHLEGSGPIVVEVSVDGETYIAVEHSAAFANGVAIVPFQFIIGDYVRISATSLTKAVVNYNNVNPAERS